MEEVVGSVYRDLYDAEVVVTGYSGDGGVDVILSVGSKQIGVQVKRYRNEIKAEQIRSLIGALVIGGLTEGMFVTTSDYQPGARKTAQKSSSAGYRIDLVNAQRFYDALKLTQRNGYQSLDDLLNQVGTKSLDGLLSTRLEPVET